MRYVKTPLLLLATALAATSCGDERPDNKAETTNHTVSSSHNAAEYHHARRMYPMAYSYTDSRGYGYYAFVHIHIRDTAYVDALKKRAEAALVKARAKARASDAKTAAIFRSIHMIEAEITRLDQALKTDREQQTLIMHHAKTLSKMAFDANTSKEVLASVKFFTDLGGITPSTLADRSVQSFDQEQFTARGEYKVEDGKIYKNTDTKSFDGNNLLAYLSFLRTSHQNPIIGSDAHKVLLDLFDEIKEAGRTRLSQLEKTKEARRTQSRKAFTQIENLIAQFK